MKKNIIILILIFIFSVLCTMFLIYEFNSTVDISNKDALLKYIAKKDKVDTVTFVKENNKDDYYCILYSYDDLYRVIIFEKIFLNRYKFKGSAGNSRNIGSYNVKPIIVIYGNNKELNANYYEFTNNNKKYSMKELGDYILDIYIIKNANSASSHGYFFDKDGKKVGYTD